MKPFSLEEYLKNPSRKVITRDGRNARIICTDRQAEFSLDGNRSVQYPVIALWDFHSEWMDGKGSPLEQISSYTVDGRHSVECESNRDLFFAPEKKEGWISIYKTETGIILPGNYIDKTEKLSRDRKPPFSFAANRIATIKIEWEE